MKVSASKRKSAKPFYVGCLVVIVTFGSMIGGIVFDAIPILQKLAQPIMCTGDEKLAYTGKDRATYRNTEYTEYTVFCVSSDGTLRKISRATVIVIQLVAMWVLLFIIGAGVWAVRRLRR